MTSQDVTDIVQSIVVPTLKAGGDAKNVLILLDNICVGVFLMCVKSGGDREVLDVHQKNVLEMLTAAREDMKLRLAPAQGNA